MADFGAIFICVGIPSLPLMLRWCTHSVYQLWKNDTFYRVDERYSNNVFQIPFDARSITTNALKITAIVTLNSSVQGLHNQPVYPSTSTFNYFPIRNLYSYFTQSCQIKFSLFLLTWISLIQVWSKNMSY